MPMSEGWGHHAGTGSEPGRAGRAHRLRRGHYTGATHGEARPPPQHPSSATQCPLKAARPWDPSEPWAGVPGGSCHQAPAGLRPLTFMNCSSDLDARELERKRVLGSAGGDRRVC